MESKSSTGCLGWILAGVTVLGEGAVVGCVGADTVNDGFGSSILIDRLPRRTCSVIGESIFMEDRPCFIDVALLSDLVISVRLLIVKVCGEMNSPTVAGERQVLSFLCTARVSLITDQPTDQNFPLPPSRDGPIFGERGSGVEEINSQERR
jgi:hypothetical protein